MDYRDELRLCLQQALLQERDSLPQPGTVTPIFWDKTPGPRILMRARASSLNYRDLMVLKGGGRGPTKIGVVPLSDGAGEVATIGDGVTRVKLGDRVIGTFHPRWFGGPLSADYLWCQPRRDAGGIRDVERGDDRVCAEAPLL